MQDLGVTLTLFSEETIRKLSVVTIRNASTTDHGTPKTAGIMDARMGSTDRSILCQTCHIPHCSGHFGMIEFPSRIILPGHIKRILALLRCVCVNCVSPLVLENDLHRILDGIMPGIDRLKFLSDHCRLKVDSCPSCKSQQPTYMEYNRLFIKKTYTDARLKKMKREEIQFHQQRFTCEEIYSIFTKISTDFYSTLGINANSSHPKDAIPKCMLVLPPCQRPTLRIADGGKGKGEDDLTVIYQDIIRSLLEYESKLEKDPLVLQDATWNSFCKMQLMAASLVKQGLRKIVSIPGLSDIQHRTSIRTMRDLEKRLKGKTGRLRGTLNAKRTDFSSRTVVGIDMTHDIWRLGVPESRMKILTIPVKVTALNMEDLKIRIIRGANQLNGATNIIQPIDGEEPKMIFLGLMSEELRINQANSLEIGWIVERHMIDGDWVWFNRQPTLHKMNIQAFQVYAVPGLTFRLPLPCTRPFNADFDGDEMNMHVPQSIEAVSEAQELMAVPYNMISPSNTSAIIALVQESLVAWFRLTRRDAIITRETFQQLMAQIHYDPKCPEYLEMPQKESYPWICPQPAIIKSPKGPRWTGKQILSVLLHPFIHITRAVRDGDISSLKSWTDEKEEIVIIRNGELLNGRLCKATLGGGPSLINQIWKDLSPWAAAKFVSDAQRIGNAWNMVDAMCINIRDCIISDETLKEVDDLVSESMGKADAVEETSFPREIKEIRNTALMQDVLRSAGALCLKRMDTRSALSTVVISGSKGNALNLSQIMAVVGQQTIGGQRVIHRNARKGMRGLVCFKPGDKRPEAYGFVATSYMQGQTESEFFHAMMAGREGIVATAVETATSGYNQRKMVKIQEGQIILYDNSVRISSKDVVMLHYGYDDYDSTHLERIKIGPLLRLSDQGILDLVNGKGHHYPGEYEKCLSARNILRRLTKPLVPSEFGGIITLPFHSSRLTDQMLALKSSSPKMTLDLCRQLHTSLEKEIKKIHSNKKSSQKTIASVFLTWPSSFFIDNHITIEQAQFLKRILLKKVQEAMVAPGEAVGTIGSTSIGEPSTQGALNTFHFSGIAEKSGVTGNKRFKELIGCAKCAETCVTNILFDYDQEKEAKTLYESLQGVYLSQIVHQSTVMRADAPHILRAKEQLVLPWMETWMTPLSSKIFDMKQLRNSLQACSPMDTSIWTISIHLEKRRCIEHFVTPTMVREKLRKGLCDTCIVLSTEDFENEWILRITPLQCEMFLTDTVFNSRLVCDAILDVLLNTALIKGIPIVSDAFHVVSTVDHILENGAIGKKKYQKVGTVGSDLLTLASMVPDASKIWTNDIHDTQTYLGIEAASLLNNAELQRVLSFDSTIVDPRHTQLLGETMSRGGTIAPLNRHKMEELGSSLLSRASFEQTLPVLEDAAFFNRRDNLSGSLERQIVGLPLRVGTGIVSIVKDEIAQTAQQFLAPLQSTWKGPNIMPLENERSNYVLPISKKSWSPFVHEITNTEEDFSRKLVPYFDIWSQRVRSGQNAILRFSFQCNEKRFDSLLSRLDEYKGWEPPEPTMQWIQTSEVLWKFEDTVMSTILKLGDSKISRTHVVKNLVDSHTIRESGTNIQVSLLHYIPGQFNVFPTTVLPLEVKIRQRKTFEKDGWIIKCTKSWRGATNLAADASVLTDDPCLTVSLYAGEMHSHLPLHQIAASKIYSLLV